MVSHDWDKFWPQGGPARTEMLDWFNLPTGNILRQQISFAESDLPLIYRTGGALQLICDKLQQVELKRVPRVENLLYFMQNTRKRLEPQLKSNTGSPHDHGQNADLCPGNTGIFHTRSGSASPAPACLR